MDSVGALRVRRWGRDGPAVVVLHGGPAAVGGAAGLAQGLADGFRVVEPWQRGSGGEPLSVARHVEDLRDLVAALPRRPAVVGESWGAMLALAYGAAYPDTVAAIALVGCGTFDPVARGRMAATLAERASDPRPYDYDALSPPYQDQMPEPFDVAAYEQTWADMLRLQQSGAYPQAFAAIGCPVLMLHGDYDPHPGAMIRDSLRPYLPQLDYREFERCGHSPWTERFAHDAFFAALRAWLASNAAR